jgi:hypothetical protein
MSGRLFSRELLVTADSLRQVRWRLVQLLRDGNFPEGAFPDISVIATDGLLVSEALERLGRDAEPRPPVVIPDYVDQRF